MNFITSKERLLSALGDAGRVIPLRTTLPILSCVLLESKENQIILTATDLEQAIKTKFSAQIKQQGKLALPNSKFFEIISALPSGEIEITTNEDNEMEIKSSKGVYKISGKDPEEYPETPKLEKEQEITFLGKELLDIIQNTHYAVSKDDLKPALCGVYIDIKETELTAVSTDGHRLVKYKKTLKTTNPEGSLIIPVKFLNLLKNNINSESEITINVSKNHIDIKGKNKTLITRIIKEQFPDFNSVIPDNQETKAEINAEELIQCLKRIVIFSNKTTKQAVLNFNNNELTITTEDQETKSSAKEHIVCSYEGPEITAGYNAQYLKEVIQNINNTDVEIYLSGALTAAVFKPKKQKQNTTLTALLMPLRITETN